MAENDPYKLLSECLNKLNPNQVEYLKNIFFTVDELSTFDGKANVHLIGHLRQSGRLDSFLTVFKEKYEEIFKEVSAKYEAKAEKNLTQDNNLEFENRVNELEKLLYGQVGLSHCWLVLGPLGYGKTKLLLELKERYSKLGWSVYYMQLNEDFNFDLIIKQLKAEMKTNISLNGTLIDNKSAEYSLGWEFAAKLQGTKMGTDDKGLVLLIDDLHYATTSTTDQIAKFINGLFEAWVHLNMYGRRPIRVISAMRNQGRVTDNIGFLGKDSIRLSPFDFRVIRNTVSNFISDPKINFQVKPENLDMASAYITHITAGHPKVLSLILHKFYSTGLFTDTWPKEDSDTHLAEVYKTLENIEKSIKIDKIASVNEILKKISILRKFNEGMLEQLLSSEMFSDTPIDALQLSNELLHAQLIENQRWSYMGDGTTRRLFFCKLRHGDLVLLKKLCAFAINSYQSRLVDEKIHRSRHVLAIELLFQHMQNDYYVEGLRGDILKSNFFENTLPVVLKDLVNGETLIKEKKRILNDIIEELIDPLYFDWEFAFCLNYFASKDKYDESIFDAMLTAIRFYQDNLSTGVMS